MEYLFHLLKQRYIIFRHQISFNRRLYRIAELLDLFWMVYNSKAQSILGFNLKLYIGAALTIYYSLIFLFKGSFFHSA